MFGLSFDTSLLRYGFDSYPGGFDCSKPSNMEELADYYVSGHNSVAPWAPIYLPEFQGAFKANADLLVNSYFNFKGGRLIVGKVLVTTIVNSYWELNLQT